MSTALCIVDMQTTFKAHRKCLKGVIHQIRLAKRRKAPIIVLEYNHEGPTHPDVMKALEGAPKVVFMKKDFDDGSAEFLEGAKKFKYKKVRITGVNGCYCVYETTCGIKKEGIPFEVVKDAIACTCGTEQCVVHSL